MDRGKRIRFQMLARYSKFDTGWILDGIRIK
jgi:hypothetical protein